MPRMTQIEVTLYLVASAALGGYLISAALFVMSGLSSNRERSCY